MSIFDKVRRKQAERTKEPSPQKIEGKKEEKVVIKNNAPEPWSIGYKIKNRYEIKDIKEGGMGIVYIAYDHQWKRYFAIKTFKKEYLWNENAINRFMQEAETWINLDADPNIVLADHVETIEGKLLIFLEYIDGGNLGDYIGRLDIPKAIYFALQFCWGMNYAHRKFTEMGKLFVHRDIKPGNVLITKDGNLKITDLGLVKSLDYDIEEIESENISENIFISKTGAVAGTPPYMSPEQFIDTTHVGVESDVYSFGVMLYEMLTGKPPFYAKDFEGYMRKHLNENPRNPSELNPEIPEILDSVVMKCLSKNPADRYHSFGEIYKEVTGEELKVEERDYSSVWWCHKGASLAHLGKYVEAIECLDKALEINSKDDAAWNNKGLALCDLRRYKEAIECYDKSLEINPREEKAWYNKGNALRYLRKYKEAIECFDKALKINRRLEEAWASKGLCLGNFGRYEEEIDCYEKALKINSRFTEAWIHKGSAQDNLGRREEAIGCFDKALDINPRDEDAWIKKGATLIATGRYKEAIECFDKALDINPRDADAWDIKGLVLTELDKYEEAKECFDRVLKITPKSEKAWYNKGFTLLKLGRNKEAIECFDKALKINPRYEEAWSKKGATLIATGRCKEAIECFDKALKINPNNKNVTKARELTLSLLHGDMRLKGV